MEGSLSWFVGPHHYFFTTNSVLNMSGDVGAFNAILTAISGKNLTSTLTNPMITFADTKSSIQCAGGTSSSELISVPVAGLCAP